MGQGHWVSLHGGSHCECRSKYFDKWLFLLSSPCVATILALAHATSLCRVCFTMAARGCMAQKSSTREVPPGRHPRTLENAANFLFFFNAFSGRTDCHFLVSGDEPLQAATSRLSTAASCQLEALRPPRPKITQQDWSAHWRATALSRGPGNVNVLRLMNAPSSTRGNTCERLNPTRVRHRQVEIQVPWGSFVATTLPAGPPVGPARRLGCMRSGGPRVCPGGQCFVWAGGWQL